MNTPVDQLLKSMDELSSVFASRMGEFEKNLSQSCSVASNPTVKTLAAEFNTFKSFVWKTLGLLKSRIELVAVGLDRLETQSRRKVLLFHGLEENNNEDVLQTMLHVLSSQLKMSDIKSTAIKSCHRLGVKKDSARPILLRFNSCQLRSSVWKAKTKLKGTRITVTEFLTKTRQEVFIAARKHFGIKKCWSSDGMIVILLPNNSTVKISSQRELKQLTEKASVPKPTN